MGWYFKKRRKAIASPLSNGAHFLSFCALPLHAVESTSGPLSFSVAFMLNQDGVPKCAWSSLFRDSVRRSKADLRGDACVCAAPESLINDCQSRVGDTDLSCTRNTNVVCTHVKGLVEVLIRYSRYRPQIRPGDGK